MLTPEGSATALFEWDTAGSRMTASYWGAGASWALERLAASFGGSDSTAAEFDPVLLERSPYAAVRDVARTALPRWRVPASGLVMDVLAATIFEQRVTGIEARRGWRSLVSAYGEPAPGPVPEGLRVSPTPQAWRSIPSWEWRKAGVDGQRAEALLRAAGVANRVAECADLPLPQAKQRLAAIPGIGPWTIAEVAQRALGDPSAVSYGDYHVAENTVYALTGRAGGTDDDLRELLAPQSDHGYRIQRMVELSGVIRPPRGPRVTIPRHR